MSDSTMNTYSRLNIAFTRGEGAYLFDEDGKRYLDAISGIAVCSLGHAHPAVAKALCEQAQTLIHTSNIYQIKLQQTLANKLVQLSGMDKVFFGNSGAEANEAAIKIARLFGHNKGIDNPQIIVANGSFHGRTMATLSATGNRKVQAGFEPLVQGFVRVPYNDIEAVKSVAAKNKNVVAILVEPVQGEGGINIPDNDYLDTLREICDQNDWLLMLDEIQTGIGRSGEWFAFQHGKSSPDVMTLAKALGNGVPIGACLARGQAANVFQPGNHGSTYGGNPLACAAAIAVIDEMEKTSLVARAASLGDTILEGFNRKLSDIDSVKNIRGKGLLIGIELDRPCAPLVQRALEKGLLINVTANQVIRLLPPIIMSDEQCETMVDAVCDLVKEFVEEKTQ